MFGNCFVSLSEDATGVTHECYFWISECILSILHAWRTHREGILLYCACNGCELTYQLIKNVWKITVISGTTGTIWRLPFDRGNHEPIVVSFRQYFMPVFILHSSDWDLLKAHNILPSLRFTSIIIYDCVRAVFFLFVRLVQYQLHSICNTTQLHHTMALFCLHAEFRSVNRVRSLIRAVILSTSELSWSYLGMELEVCLPTADELTAQDFNYSLPVYLIIDHG